MLVSIIDNNSCNSKIWLLHQNLREEHKVPANDSKLNAMETMVMESLGEVTNWSKPVDLYEMALTKLFLSMEEVITGRVSISEQEIDAFLENVDEKFKSKVEDYGDSPFDAMTKYVRLVVAVESVEQGKWMIQDKFLSDEQKVDSNDVDIASYANDNVSFVDEYTIGAFAQKREVVLAQLANTIPRHCESYYERVFSTDDNTTDLQILRMAYEERMNTLLLGEAGAGKTLSLKRLAYDLEVPYKSISLNGACTIEDLIGHFVRGYREDLNAIDWVWVDGWLTKFARYGGIFVAEEINAAPPEILFVLHDLLGDVTRKLDLTQAGGDVIHAHPGFFFAATANPDYDGTQSLNKALLDRFDITLDYPYDIDIERRFIKDTALLEMAVLLRGMYPHEISRPVSTRLLKQFERNRSLLGMDTARKIFINRFPENERAAISSAFQAKME